MNHTDERTPEERAQHYMDLLNERDDYLFMRGGCQVFALALHERFKYALRLIPADTDNSMRHIYCRFAGASEYAVDVEGWTPEPQRLREPFECDRIEDVRTIDRAELLRIIQRIKDQNLCGRDEFFVKARKRADDFIEEHKDIFSGKRKERISN